MTSRRWGSALASVCVVASLWATQAARADRAECNLDPPTGLRTCGPRVSCATRATCIDMAVSDTATCQNITAPAGPARECMPDCTTLFACTSDADCPRISGIVGMCAPTDAAPQICVWHAQATSTVPLDAQITYCTPPRNHVGESAIAACHHVAGSVPSIWTDDYFRGDCDGDGCPNGHDTDPCVRAINCLPSSMPFDSPFCAPLPALACSVSGSTFSCGDARPCNPLAASPLPCSIGTCESGWSDAPRCRPTCSTLFLCQTGSGTRPEQCPVLNGATGVCLPLPAAFMSIAGRDGLCIYSTFFDSSCLMSAITAQCFRDATTGAFQDNFFAGDCDGDGDPNGCDRAAICNPALQGNECSTVPGLGCTPTYTPRDAGVDAAGNVLDAGGRELDASSNALDAGMAGDVGASGFDANNGTGSGSTSTFGGGGGCRCAAVGTSSGSRGGAALLIVGMLLALARGRRRGGTLARA